MFISAFCRAYTHVNSRPIFNPDFYSLTNLHSYAITDCHSNPDTYCDQYTLSLFGAKPGAV